MELVQLVQCLSKFLAFIVIFFSCLVYSNETLDVYPPTTFVNATELYCLAQNIYFESRGESKIGQIAVAHVTLNRVRDPRFPKNICAVVKQPYQFSWVHTIPSYKNIKISPAAKELALEILLNKHKDPTAGALFFHNKTIKPFKRTVIATIGNHTFYR